MPVPHKGSSHYEEICRCLISQRSFFHRRVGLYSPLAVSLDFYGCHIYQTTLWPILDSGTHRSNCLSPPIARFLQNSFDFSRIHIEATSWSTTGNFYSFTSCQHRESPIVEPLTILDWKWDTKSSLPSKLVLVQWSRLAPEDTT